MKIVSLPKDGDLALANNDRPVSLLRNPLHKQRELLPDFN